MIELKNDRLVFSFPEVHEDATCSINFQRTLRIPDDNQEYPLPPGLGSFPLAHVDDYSKTAPDNWKAHGGVFLPMYQAEAMWLCFNGNYPFAIKIAAGKINAVTGEQWTDSLSDDPQDFVQTPEQPWLDGFCVSKGTIRQFVAMPLGEGYSAEEQITGKAEHGGLQIIAYPMKRERYEEIKKQEINICYDMEPTKCTIRESSSSDMGLAPGGLMRQEIYESLYDIDVWDTTNSSRCFIHIANSLAYKDITGTAPPTTPPTAQQYNNAGLPWFEYYDAEQTALKGADQLAGLDSVAAMAIKWQNPLDDNKPLNPKTVIPLKQSVKVREGEF